MGTESYRIRPEWPDAMVYEEGDARSIRFDCRSLHEPPRVLMPAAELWAEKMPAWAHDRRDLIVTRLRQAACLVLEEGADATRVLSPDGTIRLEMYRVEDERSGLWETVRVLAEPSGDVLAHLMNYGVSDVLRFPGPGLLIVSLTDRSSQRRLLQINAATRTFRMDPHDDEESLDLLPERLGLTREPAALVPPRFQAGFSGVLSVVTLLGSLVLALGGAWMMVTGDTTKDRWIGGFGLLFFGACLVTEWRDRRNAR